MFLQTPNKPSSRSLSTTKSRLNAHNHKFETVESRKRSPENYSYRNSPQSPQAPTDVMVFTSSQSHHSNRPPQGSRAPYPEYPGVDEMYKYVQDVWDQKMTEANAPNSKIKCLNLSKPSLHDKPLRKDSTGTAPPTAPAKRHSPHQYPHPNKKY